MKRWLGSFLLLLLIGCGSVSYPRLGINEPVVVGEQRQIDQGYVVDIVRLPGIWLAGHRTTHGSVFHNLPDARVGDRLNVRGQWYRVVAVVVWPFSRRALTKIADVVLQTSLPDGNLLVLADHE